MLATMSPTSRKRTPVRVVVEIGSKRVFASALDWPGWARSGRDEAAALEALAAYQTRYARALTAARIPFNSGDLVVAERVTGDATTDFGAPSIPAAAEEQRASRADAARLVALVEAAWRCFDAVVAGAPPSLRKGPRGGGRDRDAIVDHVLGAEHAYSRKLGVRQEQPRCGQTEKIAAARREIAGALTGAMAGSPMEGARWPARYVARRMAWHVLDHAWEIEDRSEG